MKIENRFTFKWCQAVLAAGMLVLGPSPSLAQQARWSNLTDTVFSHLGQADGLPAAAVTAIAADGAGFLWIGTSGGLARWDGYRFRNFLPNAADPGSIPESYIQCLHTDRRGRLWIGMNGGGFAYYDSAHGRFVMPVQTAEGAARPSVAAFADDDADGLWIATDSGLDHFEIESGRLEHLRDLSQGVGLANVRASALLRDRSGDIWVGTNNGLVRKPHNSTTFATVVIPYRHDSATSIQSLFEDGDGRIWIGTSTQGAFLLEPGQAGAYPLRATGSDTRAVETQWIQSIVEVRPEEVWLGIRGEGIVAVNSRTGQMRSIHHDASQATSLSHDRVWSLFRDRAGLIWVGSTGGLDRYDPTQTGLSTIYRGPKQIGGSAESDVVSVLSAADGRVWLGYGNNGVDVIDPTGEGKTSLRPNPDKPETALPRNIVTALHQAPSGVVLIGTERGLYRSDPDGRGVARLTVAADHPEMWVRALLTEGDRLWVGSNEDGLWRFDHGIAAPAQRIGLEALTDQRIRAILAGPDGKLWIGTRNGLNRFDPVTGENERILPDRGDAAALAMGFVSTLQFDAKGRLWVGTMGGGIHVLLGRDDKGRPRFRRIGTEQGLPHGNIDKLLLDQHGNIWASTDDGLAIVDPDTLTARAFHRAEGSAISSYYINSGAATGHGELVFGGDGGITVVHPEQVEAWNYPPPVVITDIRIDGRPISPGALISSRDDTPLTIGADERSLSVEFSALDYSAPERNRFAYMLDGFDKSWVETDWTRRIASYTNLPPGDYRLFLRGSNRNGSWSLKTLSLPVHVWPKWYETLWFRLMAVVLGLSAVVLLVQSRTRYLRARQKQLENQVEQRTSQLRQSSERIASLLDNSGEGFLSFGPDLIIEEGCSRACTVMLGGMPVGRPADRVLFGGDALGAELFRNTVAKAIPEKDAWRAQLYLSLLPSELHRGELTLRVEYKRLESGHLMAVLTDVTEEKRLAARVEEEHRRLALIVAAVAESREFFAALDSYRSFAGSIRSELQSSEKNPNTVLRDLYRQVHTFKGLLSQFHFQALPQGLHELEELLADLRRFGETQTMARISMAIDSIDFAELLDQDLAPLRQTLGDRFVERGNEFRLSADQIAEMKRIGEKLLHIELPEEARAELRRLYGDIARLGHLELAGALAGFDRVIAQQAVRLEKEISPLVVEISEDIWVDPAVLGPFFGSLVHVFRNAAVHGIEAPDARLAAGKPAAGSIRCTVETIDGRLHLTIADDGVGIRVEALRAKIVGLGLMTAEQAGALSEDALLDLVFLDGLSTSEKVDEVSGRGVGLAAVRAEARALGGDVVVRSAPGSGTSFHFTLPLAPMEAAKASRSPAQELL